MVAQHIHDTYLWNGHAEEVGALRHARSHQQPAVGAADDGYLLLGGITLLNQVFSRSDEVVEDILLLHLRSCLVPLLTILATTSEVYLHIDTALLQEGNAHGREIGR